MKIAAHPLVVAAALGLLGPGALEETGEAEARSHADTPRPPVAPAPVVAESASGWSGLLDERLYTVEAPAEEDLARVAREWEAITSPRTRGG